MFDLGFGLVGFEPLQAWLLSDLPTVTATVTFLLPCLRVRSCEEFLWLAAFLCSAAATSVQRSLLGVVSFV